MGTLEKERIFSMTTKFARFAMLAGKINRQHVQFVLALLVLAMLVLGAGAPASGGGLPPH
jgi:hypothetical protein